jgi:chromosome segregation ATPase
MPTSKSTSKNRPQLSKHADVADLSSTDSIPSPVSAELERKTRECETAKKLIEVMKQYRATDLEDMNRLKSRLDQTEGELVSEKQKVDAAVNELNSSKAALTRMESEMQTLTDTLELSKRNFDLLSNRHQSELRMKNEEIKSLNARLSVLIEETRSFEKERQAAKSAAAKSEQFATELAAAKQSAERRARNAETQQMKLSDKIKQLEGKLAGADATENDLREEIENLLLQQTQAIERVSEANKVADAKSKLLSDTCAKLKNATHKIETVEKSLTAKDAQVTKLQNEIQTLRMKFETDLATVASSAKSKSTRNSVIACILTWIVAQIFFLLTK